jgi:acyl-CoA reductase-like NAD-dependent aldehyde dehydrogenase
MVFPDVDIAEIAEKSIAWKMRNSGQVCVAPQRFFVHSQVAEEFIERTGELAAKWRLGYGLDEGVQMGPLINAKQRDRVEALVNEAVGAGASVLAGGARPDQFEKGYFYQPTVMTNIQTDMPLYHEEIFGPVMPIIPFSDTDEALAMANDSEYGLTAFVFTHDLNTATRMSEELEYGMVCVNDWLPALPEAPFGGVKQSGMGYECGSEGVEEYLETKTIFIGGLS